ncbi:MAG: GYF domain-containing protein [Myxococcota bacterium]
MKFFCDSCSTKYSISDEKIRGKILKVRCKNCGNVITVREQRLPTESSAPGRKPQGKNKPQGKKPPHPPAPPSSPRFDPSDVEWHYAINGKSFGPFELEGLRAKYRSGEIGDETYVWTESFSNWKPVTEVEWFQEALQASQQKSPRNKTIGVSGSLEAIKPEDVEKYQSEKNKQKASNTQRQRAVEGDRQAAQQERLHALRARLKSGDAEQPENEVSDEFDGGAATVVGSSSSDWEQGVEDDSKPPERASAEPQRDELELDEPEPDDGESSGLFSGLDQAGETVSAGEDEAEKSGRIPFSPQAPELESDAKKRSDTGKKESVTGSLLIQLDQIQKEGRGGRALMIAAVLLLIGGIVGAGFYLHSQNREEAKETAQKSRLDDEDDEEEVTVKTYSNDEQKRILTIGSQTVTEEESEEAAAEKEESDGAEDERGADKKPEKVAAADTEKTEDGLRLRGGSLAEGDDSVDDALAGATKSKGGDDGFRKKLDEGSSMGAALDSPIKEGSSFESMGGIKSDRSSPIYNPTDSIEKKKGAAGPRLTSEQISEGFRNVRRSIGICRQRHARRGGPLDARKLYLTLEIKPTGRVKGYDLEPKKVQNTEFDRCLSSHKGRWSFPSFGGSSTQKVRAPIVLD